MSINWICVNIIFKFPDFLMRYFISMKLVISIVNKGHV